MTRDLRPQTTDFLAPGDPIHVRKLRPDGSEVFAWDGEVLRCDAQGIVLRAEFNVPVRELGYATFRRGDVFHEFYYWDRWYNVFDIREPSGALKGWYANVGAPATLDGAAGQLSYVDLELDLWSSPDGRIELLDEDDFAAEVATGAISVDLAAGAEQGWHELIDLARAGRLPRWSQEPGLRTED